MPMTSSIGSSTASISRRTAWFLLGVAVWMAFVWGTFIRNLARDELFTGMIPSLVPIPSRPPALPNRSSSPHSNRHE